MGRLSADCEDETSPSTGLPAFYAVPGGVAGKSPGTLLKSEVVASPAVEGSVHRVMYVSTDEGARSVAVTGLVFVPSLLPPRRGYPVVSWAHGTNGMSDKCAPSLDPLSALPTVEILNNMLGRGWVVTVSDYQGEGTPPDVLPFLVGGVAGRNVIDIVAAARQLPGAHAGCRYVVWGYSEGGHAAMFAWQMGGEYGARNGLHPVGIVSGAPPSHMHYTYDLLSETQHCVYFYMAVVGFNAAYGDGIAPLDDVLTEDGSAMLPVLRNGCLEAIGAEMERRDPTRLFEAGLFEIPPWRRLFMRNDPGYFRTGAETPLLIVHGSQDEVIPAVTSAVLAQQLARNGYQVERWVYSGLSHGPVVDACVEAVLAWTADRLRGGGLESLGPFATSGPK